MGTLHDDLEVLATGIAKRLQEPWSSVLPSIIDAAERDKKLAELHAQIHGQMRGALLTVIERGRRRGELPRSEDALELVASIFGPLFYRRFLSREPLDEAFARKVVERALRKGD